MKLSNKLVEWVVKEVAGEDVVPLVNSLKNKKNISEFKIADDIKREINLTRNMLYRLYHANLVSFIRRKDKKKGWYIYYWTFNLKRVIYLAQSLKKQRLESLKERLKRERENYFYSCVNKCIRLDFDRSTGFNFKCPECGELMTLEDNKRTIEEIEKEIGNIEAELNTFKS